MPDVVYHYTNAAGLLGIGRSGNIWCTHVGYLNDAQEYRYVSDQYRRALAQISADGSATAMRRRIAEVTMHHIDRAYAGLAEYGPPQYLEVARGRFVASFSELDDDLSQWRGYGGPGPKFAIGFSVEALRAMYELRGFKFEQVEYGVDDLEQTFRAAFSEFAGRLERDWLLPNGRYDDPYGIHPPEYRHFISSQTEPYAALRKHPKFKAEAEWRLYGSWAYDLPSRPVVDVDLREGRGFLIPYMAVPICDGPPPIVSLTIGPSPHPEASRAAAESLRRWSAFRGLGGRLPIRISEIPYRDW